ncbi:hypothetical protein CFOL_v3_03252 [Cephalotus follicularis]|uniref:Uncharacterized protein n=1 Tax=Cephalotus follicularis TaxID=3775 RepID=A0A1Q3AVG7_CEPFO|nr:hypothetical protein CFOL_v3_03252 [Cephalotus follicularis]
MRIRKNLKLFSQAYECQLNQSPWDVISFSNEVHPSSNQQFKGNDSFIENVSSSKSSGAVKRVASMMESNDELAIKKTNKKFIVANERQKVSKVFNDKDDMKTDKEFGVFRGMCCDKDDCEGYQCKKMPEDENSVTLIKSPNDSTVNIKINHERSGRSRVARRGSSSTSNLDEFYYYSGFGPWWGKKKRGYKESEGSKSRAKKHENGTNQIARPSSASQIDVDYKEYMEDDGVEGDKDEDKGDCGSYKMRKPLVKERSLKSLM